MSNPTIKAERVDVYCKRHGIQEISAGNKESFVLITDDKESIFVGERKEFVENSVYDKLVDDSDKVLRLNAKMLEALEFAAGALESLPCACREVDGHRDACPKCMAESVIESALLKAKGEKP